MHHVSHFTLAKLYKSHSLRKGGATAMLGAKVSLPQIQLMARWASPNMAQLYAEFAADVLMYPLTSSPPSARSSR